jgi:ABC-type sugar transport system substrate-binding protein
MRTKRLLATVVAAVGAATCLAAPAVAQTQQQIDQAFLQGVRDKGVPIKDDAKALELAHATCNLLNEGGSTNEALQLIQKSEKKWSDDDVLSFGGLAVYAYCKKHLPEPQA